jgi:thioredoxin reductase
MNDNYTDYLIIGAGPAGLQLGYFFEKAGRDYRILEAGPTPGTFFRTFPRHRTLISINKVYTGFDDPETNLRWDWNSLLSDDDEMLFKHYSGKYFPDADVLVRYLTDYAQRFHLRIDFDAKVSSTSRQNNLFHVQTANGKTYSSARLIVATGVPQPYVPQIPGIELAKNYTEVSLDQDEFKNKRVLIIGKGNSGFETADHLTPVAAVIHLASPNPLRMAWQTHFVGHLRAINNNVLDTYQLKSQNAVLDASIEKIERHNGQYAVSFNYSHANGEREEILYDNVILASGFRMDTSFFDESARPALVIDERFPAQTSEWESTNVKDLYFAGTLTQCRDFKKTTSGFIHGFRYNVRALHRILERKHHEQSWPRREMDASPQALCDAVIKRVNQTSALWQQFGFLCDYVSVDPGGQVAHYYEELPVSYVRESDFGEHERYFLITLEYGPEHAFNDPFNIERVERNDVRNASRSNFLHPIVRHYSGSILISEHHVIEDLAAQWLEEVHTQPLLKYFSKEARVSDNRVQFAAAGYESAGND